MFCRTGFGLLLAGILLSTSCNRAGTLEPPRKIAVLRFENLSTDASLDWAGRALSEMLGKELSAISFAAIGQSQQPFSPHPVTAPGISSEKTAALLLGATDLITGYFTSANGKLVVTAVEEHAATGKTIRSVTASGDIFSASDLLVSRFTTNPKAFPTHNRNALRLYAQGLESSGPAAAAYFEQATAADPNFGDAYLAWSRSAAASGDRTQLEHALSAASSRGSALSPLDQAYVAFESATIHQNAAARMSALSAIVKLAPGNATDLRALADAEVNAHRFQSAILHYEAALRLVPDDPVAQNLLSYAKMFAGDYPGALASIRTYQKLRPEDPNAIDSEGDIHFYFGHFAEAERAYLGAFTKSPDFQGGTDGRKAARARLMTGDVSGASRLFQNFHDARTKAGDQTIPFQDAEWTYVSGRREEGVRLMKTAGESAKNPQVRSLCFSQAAIWDLAAGQTREAVRDSTLAFQSAAPQTATIAGIARFLAQPPAPEAEWRARADRMIKGPNAENLRSLAVAYALLLSGDFADAVPAWKAQYENNGPTDQTGAFLYAGALVKTGDSAAAAPILKTNPIPSSSPAATFECLYFPALFAWRGDQVTFTKLGGTPLPAK